jgi:hypothetical protein
MVIKMNRIEVIQRLKDVLPKTEAGFVDIFLKTLEVESRPSEGLVVLRLPGRHLGSVMQLYGSALERCFEEPNVCMMKGNKVEWIKKERDYVLPRKETKAMWWQN